mmetsp:Transcript_9301/g.11602  ORF Transcript_9301/g.11602 Transcript_9301/m.11602 type:complete len:207 (-) Transcript_9301:28-648(-)
MKSFLKWAFSPSITTFSLPAAFSGSLAPQTFNPSLTPYGGSQTMVSIFKSERNALLVKSMVKMSKKFNVVPYCLKFALMLHLSFLPLNIRISISDPIGNPPKLAAATKKEPVPVKGSYVIFPGPTCPILQLTKDNSASKEVVPMYFLRLKSYLSNMFSVLALNWICLPNHILIGSVAFSVPWTWYSSSTLKISSGFFILIGPSNAK